MQHNTQFLIHSGDKSENIWKYWYYYWKKYWTCSDFIDTVFLCENKQKEFPGVTFKKTGNVSWATGLINYLENIDVTYIIYQHEDYFLTEPTNAVMAKSLIDLCIARDFKMLKCCGHWAGFIDENVPMKKIDINNHDIKNDSNGELVKVNESDDNIWLYNNYSPYLISHQTSIWNREFLISTLKHGETPWEHELAGTIRLRRRNIPVYVYRGKGPFEYCETMVHGNIRPGQEKYFEVNASPTSSNTEGIK